MSSNGRPCRYYLQGNCRFGDRCKFYHPKGNAQEGRRGKHQEPPQNYGGRSGEGKNWNRYSLLSDFDDGGGGSYQHQERGRQSDRYHYISSDYRAAQERGGGGRRNDGGGNWKGGEGDWRGGGGEGQRNDGGGNWKGGGGEGDWKGGGGGGGNWRGGRSGGNWRGGGGRGDGGGGNWRGGGGGGSGWRGGGGGGGRDWRGGGGGRGDGGGGGSGWRGGGGGGWKGEREERGRTGSDNTQQDLVPLVRTDMEEWQNSSMWPLSCYGSSHELNCFPGLVDVSPDEIRLEAYTAKVLGKSEEFLKNVEELCTRQAAVRIKYVNLTLEDLDKVKQGQFPPTDSTTGLFGSLEPTGSSSGFASVGNNGISMGGSSLFTHAGSNSSPMQASHSLFGVSDKPNTRTDQSLFNQSSVTTGSNTLGPKSLFPVPAATIDSSLFSSLASTAVKKLEDLTDQLTQEEIDAFKADRFVFGEIPEHPPPDYLC